VKHEPKPFRSCFRTVQLDLLVLNLHHRFLTAGEDTAKLWRAIPFKINFPARIFFPTRIFLDFKKLKKPPDSGPEKKSTLLAVFMLHYFESSIINKLLI
jgi:hypothetical protein